MFFRFCRLYELGIRPVFVFDGPNRPKYKRNKEINTTPYETKFRRDLIALIKFFNFSMWEAYGEAEAECAMLERLGFVDMIFTGDSDIFLFGARHVVRQWPSKRHELMPCFDSAWISDITGLDRSDLILIALLRGSDYDTQGTKGIGTYVAAQLSKCHFHRAIMDDIQLFGREHKLDDERLQHLFDDLTYELHHNTSKNLLRKRTNVTLDSKFFDFSIVIDFIHPTTNIGNLNRELMKEAKELEDSLNYHHEPDWLNLAAFSQISFKWPAEYLLKRFSSLLYPGYMANKLRKQQPNFKKKGDSIRVELNSHDNSLPQTQTTLEQFYRSSLRLHMKSSQECDLVGITGSKLSTDNIKLYRVEWNRSTFESFQQIVQLKLNWENFQDLCMELLEEEAKTTGTDSFSLVKRQWVDSTYIHYTYPSIALEYQTTLSKKRTGSSQTRMNDFLILPPKKNKHHN